MPRKRRIKPNVDDGPPVVLSLAQLERAVEAPEHTPKEAQHILARIDALWQESPPQVRANLLTLRYKIESEQTRGISFEAVVKRCDELRTLWESKGCPESVPRGTAEAQ